MKIRGKGPTDGGHMGTEKRSWTEKRLVDELAMCAVGSTHAVEDK